MGALPPDPPPPAGTAAEDRLDSWKEIAAYLRRDVTTVQRWEKRERMPVHRHLHDRLGSVFAFRSELDGWAHGRNLPPAPGEVPPESAPDVPSRQAAVGAEVDRGHEAAGPGVPIPHPPSPRRIRAAVAWSAAAAALGAAGVWWGLGTRDSSSYPSLFARAQFQHVTDFAGIEQAAAVSRDGRLVAFLADRDGRMDVWLTHLGTGQFYNLTLGRVPELVNPAVRTLGFSPDGGFVTFWARGVRGSAADISIWSVPTLGGTPRPYLEGAAEVGWSGDGSRLVYHTPGPGDPTFVRDARGSHDRQIFVARTGSHAHFPVWSPDGAFIYFVQGSVPAPLDIWRIPPAGGAAERITQHHSRVSHPVFVDDRTLLYLAADADGAGPWLYSLDVERRVPHRIWTGLDRYTSLAASADGRRLVATLASPKGTLWRLPLGDRPAGAAAAEPITLTTASGFAPRLGAGYLLYASSTGRSHTLWKLSGGAATELWSLADTRIAGGPEIAADGQRVVFSVEQANRTLLCVMNADGTQARVVTDALPLHGAPGWAPDGRSIISAVIVDGTPRLVRIGLDGAAAPLVQDYSTDPVWSPDGTLLLYTGAEVGTRFPVKAASASGEPRAIPDLTLTRGGRRLRFLPGRRALVAMRGELGHKNLWLIDLDTGAERQLTDLPADFSIRDFDVSPDGRTMVVERVQEHSDVVLIELPPRR